MANKTFAKLAKVVSALLDNNNLNELEARSHLASQATISREAVAEVERATNVALPLTAEEEEEEENAQAGMSTSFILLVDCDIDLT